jgi:hypothetical protein
MQHGCVGTRKDAMQRLVGEGNGFMMFESSLLDSSNLSKFVTFFPGAQL